MAKIFSKDIKNQNIVERLNKLSNNLWWTWNPEAQAIFKKLSPLVWHYSNHNAVEVMQELSEDELKTRLLDEDLFLQINKVLNQFEQYLSKSSTWTKHNAPKLKNPIAYFSAEYGLHESLPIYSGGLGILSGDHMKSASDLGLPLIGIGLFYQKGYFKQVINNDGWQEEVYPINDPEKLPLELLKNSNGERLINFVQIGNSVVYFQTWILKIGRVSLYLMDTNIQENDTHFKELTSTVYGGNIDTRIGQEIILGMGGVKLLKSIGVTPSVYHMNEGHSAFLVFELLQQEILNGKTKEDAEEIVRSKCIFTTHTPVPAGHDRFHSELMAYTFEKFRKDVGLSHEQLMSYGRLNASDLGEPFTMTILALKMSRNANGVSELHGHVSRDMWKNLFNKDIKDVPIGHITNGIHTAGWATAHAHDFWNKRLGYDWTEKLLDNKFWKKIINNDLATDEEIWALRYLLRRDLVEYVRRIFLEKMPGNLDSQSLSSTHFLSPDVLTIGFARRFATYKRASLIFKDLGRIIPILNDQKKPVQIIFAGKAHPRDYEGKRLIQNIYHITKHPAFLGKVVFIENYDINVARHLISGVDVWMNNPRRPLEASGTSGMKVTIHGGLNMSIMDGWWREAFNGNNGWKIGEDENEPDLDIQDTKDFEGLLKTLSEQVIPEFYNRDENGIPRAWIKRIRNAMQTLLPQYNTNRMVAEYTNKYYQ